MFLLLRFAVQPLLQAASEIGADSIVMDCEDGVAINMKDVARQTIALMLDGEGKQPAVHSIIAACAAGSVTAKHTCGRLDVFGHARSDSNMLQHVHPAPSPAADIQSSHICTAHVASLTVNPLRVTCTRRP